MFEPRRAGVMRAPAKSRRAGAVEVNRVLQDNVLSMLVRTAVK
jgi:hypothetical protein